MSLYGLYYGNTSTNAILYLHMERTFIGAVQDISVYSFVLQQCLTVFYNAVML